jgi:imidazolonepropionase-like amidohydrolase
MKKYILILLFVGTSYSLFSQQTPADLQSQSIVIYNAHIHIGNGDIIENGSIGFKNGIIDYVGSKADMDNYQETINANGKHVYPGFIATNSTLGLAEVDAVRATRDEDEIGDFLPHIRAAINPG